MSKMPDKDKNEYLEITTGVEFETGRKIDGKTEYGKRFNLGNLPNSTTAIVETNLSNITYARPPERLSYKCNKQ